MIRRFHSNKGCMAGAMFFLLLALNAIPVGRMAAFGASTPLLEPILLISVTASPETLTTPSSVVTFTIAYGNGGTSTARDVMLEFFAPNHDAGEYFTELVSISTPATDTTFGELGPSGRRRFQRVRFKIGELKPGKGGKIEIQVRLATDAVESRVLTGNATIGGANYRPSMAAANVMAIFIPALTVIKRLQNEPVLFGANTTFIITVHNRGNATADRVLIWDVLPTNMQFLSSRPDTSYTRGDTLFWLIPSVAPNDSANVVFRVHLHWPPEPYPDQMVNRFGYVYEELRSAPDSLVFSVASPPWPDLVPEWMTISDTLSPGYPSMLSFDIRNRGDATAESVWVAVLLDGAQIDSFLVGEVAPETPSTGTWIWRNPSVGRHVLTLVVDPWDRIDELDESNNVDSLTIHVGISRLAVQINAVSFSDSIPGMLPGGARRASFPAPILAYISVTDQNGLPVRGLADTTRWIGAADSTSAGTLLAETWSRLLEYHLENPAIPADPDLYHVVPPVWMREVSAGRSPVAVVLVMDYSGSMSGYEPQAEAAAQLFLSLLNPGDQIGIVHFSSDVDIISPLTSDFQAVSRIIPGHEASGSTALYDGIYAALSLLADIPGRKAVILYTDGGDNASSATSTQVSSFANQVGASIYALGIGGGVERDALRFLAESTGGLAVFGTELATLTTFYQQVLTVLSSYYLLAYGSPDPSADCSRRVLDVTVTLQSAVGRDTLNYQVPCAGPDASIDKFAFVDSSAYLESLGDSVSFVASGEEFDYFVVVRNQGTAFSQEIEIKDKLEREFEVMAINPAPTVQNADTLVWRIGPLEAGQVWRAHLQLRAEYDPFAAPNCFVNLAWICTTEDTALANNTVVDTLFPLPPEIVLPEIRVQPKVIEPGDSVTVRLLTHMPTREWWIEVQLADGTVITNYAEELRVRELVPGKELILPEKFGTTRMRTPGEQEEIRFTLVIIDVLGRQVRSDPAVVQIRGKNHVVLSQNVFRPEKESGLTVRFELSSNRAATINVFDISGRKVRTLADDEAFLAGWNEVVWDGRDEQGVLVGAGLYVVTVESSGLKEWRKVIIVR